jgi:hypothetical protein
MLLRIDYFNGINFVCSDVQNFESIEHAELYARETVKRRGYDGFVIWDDVTRVSHGNA